MNTIYLDNASTTLIKPEIYYQSFEKLIRNCVNPARGNYKLALESSMHVFDTRQKLAQIIGCKNECEIIFTASCTFSLNLAISGIIEKLKSKDRILNVLMTPIEHNASARVLHHFEKLGIIKTFMPKYCQNEVIDYEDLQQICRSIDLDLAVINHASNVTGQIIDICKILDVLPQKTIKIVDGAQILPYFDYSDILPKIDALAIACHKGLLGPIGVSALYLSQIHHDINPVIKGGTGSYSESLDMPNFSPDRFEAGSMNSAMIGALGSSLDYLSKVCLKQSLTQQMESAFQIIKFVKSHSDKIKIMGVDKNIGFDEYCRKYLPIISFKINDTEDDLILNELDANFSICVRGGLHCSTITHQSLNSNGAIRISLSQFNTQPEIEYFLSAISSLIG